MTDSPYKQFEDEILHELSKIVSETNRVTNSEELLEKSNQINQYVDFHLSKLEESNNIRIISKLYELTSAFYKEAAEIVKNKQELSNLKNFSSYFSSQAKFFDEKASSNAQDIAENYHMGGLSLQNESKFPDSINYFDRALSLDPFNTKYLIDKGVSLFALQHTVDAIKCYDKALEINPEDPIPYFNKGLAFEYLKKYEEALTNFDRAGEKNRDASKDFLDVNICLGKGRVLYEQKNYQESQFQFQKALKINEKWRNDLFSSDAHLWLSFIYADQEKYDDAIQHARKSLEYDQGNPRIKANLAEFLLHLDEHEERERLVDEVLQELPTVYDFTMLLVRICSLYFRNENIKAADKALELIQYYQSIIDKPAFDWDFSNMRRIVESKKHLLDKVKSILFDFITLGETTDLAKKRLDILERLPEKVNKSKNVSLPTSISNTVSNFFKTDSKIKIRNTAKPSNIIGWYDWEVFLTPKSALNNVNSVTYYLHKTFPNPIRMINKRKTGFKLKSRGWGEFQIKAVIEFKDGKKQTKYHWLELDETPLDPEK